MAKAKGMHGDKDRKQRGRSQISDIPANSPTSPMVPQVAKTEANRAGPGNTMTKHRGDRRDMNQTYTTNEKHAARGNTPRKDVSTRAR